MLLASELDNVLQTGLGEALLERSAIGSIANHDEARRQPRANAPKNLEHGPDALDRAEIRRVHDHVLDAAGEQPMAKLGHRLPAVDLAVQEVRDDANVSSDTQRRNRVRTQAVRDRGDAMRLLDRESHDARV